MSGVCHDVCSWSGDEPLAQAIIAFIVGPAVAQIGVLNPSDWGWELCCWGCLVGAAIPF